VPDRVEPALALGALRTPCPGSRAIIKHIDDFHPVHNLASLADLTTALARIGPPRRGPHHPAEHGGGARGDATGVSDPTVMTFVG
jgi:hypothetical protein